MDQRELMLAGAEIVNRGERTRIPEVAHPEIVYHPIRAAVSGDYYGHAGIEKFMDDNDEMFDLFEVHVDEFVPLDADRLYVGGTARIRGKGSHVETTVVTAGIATFKDGLLIGWHDYGDRAAAREAAGLG